MVLFKGFVGFKQDGAGVKLEVTLNPAPVLVGCARQKVNF